MKWVITVISVLGLVIIFGLVQGINTMIKNEANLVALSRVQGCVFIGRGDGILNNIALMECNGKIRTFLIPEDFR